MGRFSSFTADRPIPVYVNGWRVVGYLEVAWSNGQCIIRNPVSMNSRVEYWEDVMLTNGKPINTIPGFDLKNERDYARCVDEVGSLDNPCFEERPQPYAPQPNSVESMWGCEWKQHPWDKNMRVWCIPWRYNVGDEIVLPDGRRGWLWSWSGDEVGLYDGSGHITWTKEYRNMSLEERVGVH